MFRGTVEQVGQALAELRREVFNFEEDETDSNDELATTTRTARAVEPSPNSGINASNILKTSEISSSKGKAKQLYFRNMLIDFLIPNRVNIISRYLNTR